MATLKREVRIRTISKDHELVSGGFRQPGIYVENEDWYVGPFISNEAAKAWMEEKGLWEE